MIEVKYWIPNPEKPNFWSLIFNTHKWDIEKSRFVNDDELFEIGLLMQFGCDLTIFKKEPYLNCGIVINSAAKEIEKRFDFLYHFANKILAIKSMQNVKR